MTEIKLPKGALARAQFEALIERIEALERKVASMNPSPDMTDVSFVDGMDRQELLDRCEQLKIKVDKRLGVEALRDKVREWAEERDAAGR